MASRTTKQPPRSGPGAVARAIPEQALDALKKARDYLVDHTAAQPNEETVTDLHNLDAAITLMAAVPELVEALKHSRMCVPFPSDCHDKVVAALAKFTGATQ